jgi:hypothetical protein
MSKTEMAARLKLGRRKFAAFAKFHQIREAGSRQLWQICLDGLDETSRQAIQRP